MAQPEKTIKVGNISLSIWNNNVGDGVVQSITISKSYQDKDKKWKTTSSLKFNELVFVRIAIDEALKDKYIKTDTAQSKPEF